jgi:hypothetical protein
VARLYERPSSVLRLASRPQRCPASSRTTSGRATGGRSSSVRREVGYRPPKDLRDSFASHLLDGRRPARLDLGTARPLRRGRHGDAPSAVVRRRSRPRAARARVPPKSRHVATGLRARGRDPLAGRTLGGGPGQNRTGDTRIFSREEAQEVTCACVSCAASTCTGLHRRAQTTARRPQTAPRSDGPPSTGSLPRVGRGAARPSVVPSASSTRSEARRRA